MAVVCMGLGASPLLAQGRDNGQTGRRAILDRDEEIALVDWQSVCTSAPEQDLAYFVTQSLTDEVRNARDWVALYHQTLIDQGIEDYDLNRCRQRYRVCALYLLCYAATIAGTLDLGNERGLQLGRTLFGNCIRSLRELDGFDLLFKLSGN